MALLSGILNHTFGENVSLTIRGRTRSPNFFFKLNGIEFPISGVQIEVDGGYAGDTTVNLVEAKIGSRTNINVRQIIYPQLAWERIIGKRKSVKSFICFYQEPVLRFIPISYVNGLCVAEHNQEKAFILEPEAKFNLYSIKAQAESKLPVLSVPFPQADKFETVLAMFNVVAGNMDITKDALEREFDIVPRQIDYYFNAMRWIGLVEINKDIIMLTENGRQIFAMTHAARIKRLAEIIFSEPIFNFVLHHPTSVVPDELFSRWNINKTTINRRLYTVRAWINYFDMFSTQKNVFD